MFLIAVRMLAADAFFLRQCGISFRLSSFVCAASDFRKADGLRLSSRFHALTDLFTACLDRPIFVAYSAWLCMSWRVWRPAANANDAAAIFGFLLLSSAPMMLSNVLACVEICSLRNCALCHAMILSAVSLLTSNSSLNSSNGSSWNSDSVAMA